MRLPRPSPGLVLRYAFLWRREFDAGQDEGRKDRPCTVIIAAPAVAGGTQVYVLPVTHTPPGDPAVAIEIPLRVKLHLGLDDARRKYEAWRRHYNEARPHSSIGNKWPIEQMLDQEQAARPDPKTAKFPRQCGPRTGSGSNDDRIPVPAG